MEALSIINDLTAHLLRLWVSQPAPSAAQMMEILEEKSLPGSLEAEGICLLLQRTEPDIGQIIRLFERFPDREIFIVIQLGGIHGAPDFGYELELIIQIFHYLRYPESKELIATSFLISGTFPEFVFVAERMPLFREAAWLRLQNLFEDEFYEQFLMLAQKVPAYKGRIATFFVNEGTHSDGLKLALSVPALALQAAEKILENRPTPENLIEMLHSNDISGTQRILACTRLLDCGTNSAPAMLCVMLWSRNDEEVVEASKKFFELIDFLSNSEESTELLNELLGFNADGDARLKEMQKRAQEILDTWTSPNETQNIVESIRSLLQQISSSQSE